MVTYPQEKHYKSNNHISYLHTNKDRQKVLKYTRKEINTHCSTIFNTCTSCRCRTVAFLNF